MNEAKKLTDEELSKATGGTNTYGNYSIGDSHILTYASSGSHIKITIEDIDETKGSPFYLRYDYSRPNFKVYQTDYTWKTLNEVNALWSKSILN